MGGMMGLGYGLGKMMEGVSGGAVAGRKYQIEDARYQDKVNTEDARHQDDVSYRDRTARFNRGVSTINTAYNLAKSSPDPKMIFRAVQERLNPEGTVVDMEFAGAPGDPEPEVMLSFPGSEAGPGWKVKGKQGRVAQVLELMEKNPDRNMDILKKGVEFGVVSIEQVPWDDPAAAGKGGGRGGAGGSGGNKVSDYMAGIKGIGAKYQVDAGGGLTFGADGRVQVDPELFMAGKDTAYTAIKKVIATAVDPAEKAAAEADLARIDYWYQQIEGILGAPGGPGVPGAPGGQGVPGGLGGQGNGPLAAMMAGPGPAAGAIGPVQGDALVDGFADVREKDVALAMDKYGMSREAVIEELKRRRATP